MTTTAPTAATSIATYSTDEQFYSTRYRQGGRTVFLVALTPAQIISNILRPNPEAKNPGNRRIRPKHAADFAKYYLEHDAWVIPGIILRAPNIFTFNSNIETPDDNVQFGVLSYPKRKQNDVQILDGQHRILGFHLALEMLEVQKDKALDHLNRTRRTEDKGSKAIKEAEAAIRQIEAKQERFYAERVSVEIQVTDDADAYRQMFFDIADNALGISASVKAQFDKRKVANRAFALVTDHPLLVNRIDAENDRLGRTGPYLLSAKHVIEVIKSVNVGLFGRIGKRVEQSASEVEYAHKTNAFFDLLMRSFPQLKNVQQGTILPDYLRQISILGSPLFIRILAGVYYELRNEHAWSDQMVEDYFSALNKHVEAPIHANSIWRKLTPEDTFNIGGYGPNGRRQDIVNLFAAMQDWAVLGEKAYPAVYADAVPAPVPEPTAEQEEIDYSDLDDPELADKLQHEDIDLGISKPSPRKRKAAAK